MGRRPNAADPEKRKERQNCVGEIWGRMGSLFDGLGWVLEGFWGVLGGSLEGLGRVSKRSWGGLGARGRLKCQPESQNVAKATNLEA